MFDITAQQIQSYIKHDGIAMKYMVISWLTTTSGDMYTWTNDQFLRMYCEETGIREEGSFLTKPTMCLILGLLQPAFEG